MIKKSYVIITLSSLITFSLTNTMDKPIDQHVHKILPFSDVHGAAFLGNNQLIIQTNNRTNNRTLLIDLTQNIDPLELANYTNHGFCKMLTNQKKTAVIIYNSFKNQEKATIYDTKQRSSNNLEELEDMPVFTNTAHTVAVKKNNRWFLYDYVTKTETEQIDLNSIITMHKPIYNLSVQYAPQKNEYHFMSFKSGYIAYDSCNNNHLYSIKPYSGLQICQYSPDGCLLACFNYHGCINDRNNTQLYDISGSTPAPLLKTTYPKTIFFTFHPSSALCVTYTDPDDTDSDKFIEYWNLETNKCIAKQQLVAEQKTPLYAQNNNSSFSADGTLLAVSFKERCVIYTVPFEVIGKKAYPLKTKERMIQLLLLLKNFQHNNELLLREIAQLLVQKILAVSELTGD